MSRTKNTRPHLSGNAEDASAAAQKPPESKDNPRERLGQLIWGYTLSQLIGVAAKLRIVDQLTTGPLFPEEIAAQVAIPTQVLRRLIRGFEICGLVVQGEDGKIRLGDLGEWLRSDVPESLYAIATRTYDLYAPAWTTLLQALGSGDTPFRLKFGAEYFAYLEDDQECVRTFNTLMASMFKDASVSILSNYDFHDARHIVDVGGGEGRLLCDILRAHPHITGTVFDRQAVINAATQVVESSGLSERCSLIAGDFRICIPASGDLYILKHVLHNWPDSWCVSILRNCRAGMPPDGRLLIIERVISNTWSPLAVRSDLHMLILMNGAERTREEFFKLLAESGFRLERSVPVDSSVFILEAVPVDEGRASVEARTKID